MREFISNLKGVWKYIKSDKKSLIILIFEHILQIGISIVLPILSAKILIELTSNEYMRILGVAIVMLIVDLINNMNLQEKKTRIEEWRVFFVANSNLFNE